MATQNPAKVKITVLKKLYHEDLVDAYLLPEKKASYPPCYRFNEGDVFIVDGFEMPAGFCPWAWADIHREIISVMFHAEFPNSKKPGCIIASCTDGLRPVIFKAESLEEAQRPLLCKYARLFLWAGLFLSKRTGPHRHGMGPYVFGGAGQYAKTAPAPSQDAPTGIRP